MFAIEAIPSLCNHFPTMIFLTSTGNALPCLLNEFISVLQCFGSVLQYFKPAAHESYLLSKNSLVTIGVSKFPPYAAKFWKIFGTRDEKLSKFRRTRGDFAYANSHEWLLAQQIALVCGRL